MRIASVDDRPDPLTIGPVSFLFYDVRIANGGPNTGTSAIAIIDPIPAPSAGGGNCGIGPPTICSFSNVPAGGTSEVRTAVFLPTAAGTLRGTVRAVAFGCDTNSGNDTVNVTTSASFLRAPEGDEVRLRLRSELTVESNRGGRGTLLLNDTAPVPTESGAIHIVNVMGRAGGNHLEARLSGGELAPGRWWFDFADTPEFVAGSIRVDSGPVISVGDRAVGFTVGKESGVIRFGFELRAPATRNRNP
jgi:hypothetical protein